MTNIDIPADPLDGNHVPAMLADWLGAAVPGFSGATTLTRLTGGQSNPTFRIGAASGDLVLRRKPLGPLLATAHAVEREFRVMGALAGYGIPVPAVHALCDDPQIAGAVFYVMDHVQGRTFHDPRLPGLTPAGRASVYDDLNRIIAAIHLLDPARIGLGDFGRGDGYLARQLTRWTRQYRATATLDIPDMETLIDWLPAHLPAEGPVRLVHGDFRLDNVLVHPTEPRIVAVLDWELSTLGDPRADFAYHMLSWGLTPDMFRGMHGTDLAALGIPGADAYRHLYAGRTDIDPSADGTFFTVLSMFRIAAILQGIAHRAAGGSAVSPDAADLGARAAPIARLARSLIDAT